MSHTVESTVAEQRGPRTASSTLVVRTSPRFRTTVHDVIQVNPFVDLVAYGHVIIEAKSLIEGTLLP